MKIKTLLFLLFISLNCFASERSDLLIGVINEELRELGRLSETFNHGKPSILLRMAELNLEKARLYRDEENKKILSISPEKRMKIKNRAAYYKRSKAYFNKAQKIGRAIVRRFRRFKHKDIVYYILAFNAKENLDFKNARRYFQLSIKTTQRGSATETKSKLGLAEIYFNEEQHRKAIPLYEAGLSEISDKWWTKDMYNLAWSYYKVGQHQRAISTMNSAFEKSKSADFIDMRPRISRDIALFYVTAGQYEKAISFYRSQGQNVARRLIGVAKFLLDQEKPKRAESVLKDAIKLATDREDVINANIMLLGLYEKYGNYEGHLKSSLTLYKLHKEQFLNDDDKDLLLFHAKKMGAILQKQVVSGTYDKVSNSKTYKGEMASKYFEIVGSLEPKKSFKSTLHQAETLYSIKKYNEALLVYDRSFSIARARKNKKFQYIAVNGMLASLGQQGISKENIDKYLLPTYLRFLSIDTKSEKAKKIFLRTFNIYMDKKDIKNAEKTLVKYQQLYPRELKNIEAMIAKVMDHHKDTGNIQEFRNWVGRIKKGEFQVSRKYLRKVQQYMLTLQFENVEKANSKGNKIVALRGYINIFNDIKSTDVAKMSAAYNASVLFYESGRPDKLYIWLKKALGLMKEKDLKKFHNSGFLMINDLFLRRRFSESAELFGSLFEKTCKMNVKRKNLVYKNATVIYIADGKINEALELAKKARSCGIPISYIRQTNLASLQAIMDAEKWSKLEKFVQAISGDDYYKPHLIRPLGLLHDVFMKNGRQNLARRFKKQVEDYYNISLRKRYSIPLESLDQVAKFKLIGLERLIKSFNAIKLKFPEKVYNNLLKKKFAMLETITSKAVEILNIGSGNGLVKTYQMLVESYQGLVYEIESFNPVGKSESYVKSFKAGMTSATVPLKNKSFEFINEARRKIKANKILSRENYWFFSPKRIPYVLDYRYRGQGILMDRGGQR